MNTAPIITGPIRVGDVFIDSRGSEWKVIDVQPFGIVDLFCDADSLFTQQRHLDVRANFKRK